MPLVEYRCGDCGHVTEFLEKTDSRAKHVCEECGSAEMARQISAFSAAVKASATASRCDTCSEGGSCPFK